MPVGGVSRNGFTDRSGPPRGRRRPEWGRRAVGRREPAASRRHRFRRRRMPVPGRTGVGRRGSVASRRHRFRRRRRPVRGRRGCRRGRAWGRPGRTPEAAFPARSVPGRDRSAPARRRSSRIPGGGRGLGRRAQPGGPRPARRAYGQGLPLVRRLARGSRPACRGLRRRLARPAVLVASAHGQTGAVLRGRTRKAALVAAVNRSAGLVRVGFPHRSARGRRLPAGRAAVRSGPVSGDAAYHSGGGLFGVGVDAWRGTGNRGMTAGVTHGRNAQLSVGGGSGGRPRSRGTRGVSPRPFGH